MQLIWIDLETSGLSSREDIILEVAVLFASLEDPFPLSAPSAGSRWAERLNPFRWTLNVDSDTLRHLSQTMHPKVIEMHTKSGLLDECAVSQWSLRDVEMQLLDCIPEAEPSDDPHDPNKNKPVLAGDSVHFDLGFIRAHMPTLAKRLSHRVYDVSAIKLFCRSLGMPKIERTIDPVHRAAVDVVRSIEHAKHCAEWLKNQGPVWQDAFGGLHNSNRTWK